MEYPKLAELLKEIRGFRNKTIYEVAEYVGVSHTYISQIENGKKLPSKKVFFPLIHYLGMKNDKGYDNKTENIKYNEVKLLAPYSEYQNSDYQELNQEYRKYLVNVFEDEMELGQKNKKALVKNEVSIHKNTGLIEEIDKPYFDLNWLLTQDEFQVFYGREYNIQEVEKESDFHDKLYFHSILKEDDIKTIHSIIEAYISSKYKKTNKKGE